MIIIKMKKRENLHKIWSKLEPIYNLKYANCVHLKSLSYYFHVDHTIIRWKGE